MRHLSIRDLQKITADAITSLQCATPIKSGNETVGLLVPFRKPDPERARRLAAWAAEVEALAKERDRELDDQVLREAGADLTDWTVEAVQKFIEEHRRRK